METTGALDRMWAVVPAGGAGTRLWPLSRAAAPKFLLDLTGAGRTLLQQTVDRLEPLIGDRVLVVTGATHAVEVRRQLPELAEANVVAEPSPRDSMAAIGLAAAMIERRDPAALLGSFAADHVIGDGQAFRRCVTEAVAVAETGRIVTIGIEPTHASTAFGYLQAGEALPGFSTARQVVSFVEKPDAATAEVYLAGGDHRWNGGMFVARAGVLLDELGREHPELARGLREIAAAPERLDEVWPQLTRIAIDHAIAEPAAVRGVVATVPGSFGWDDIGDFASLGTLLSAGEQGVKVLGADDLVLARDSTGIIAPCDRTIAVLGVHDIVVIDTGDALLVTDLDHAQDVKALVTALRDTGRDHLT